MKKVGLLTFPNSKSYGAAMQMYALYRSVEKTGAEVEIINYFNEYMKQEKHFLVSNGVSEKIRKLKRKVGYMLHCRQYSGFNMFEHKMKKYPVKHVTDIQSISDIDKRYDAVICGSDQVWNAKITDGDLHFFLDFCGSGTRRIAYAPSFGKVEYSQSIEEEIKAELAKFDSLSVREEEGLQYIQQISGLTPELVLDPTFLLNQEEWTELEKTYPIPKEEYILYYTIRTSHSLMKFCRELAEKENKKMVIVGGNVLKKMTNRDKRVIYANDLAPGEWLYLFHHASCVVTNSFHGTAFSIHYQKDFYVEYSSDTNSRLEQIVTMTGQTDRVVGIQDTVSDEHIDYEVVESRIAQYREHSQHFLQAAIQ